MELLKQSTAFTETIGPILDSTGAEYNGAVIGDLSISKNGTEAAMAAAATLTNISNGHYTLVGTTGNSDTLGRTTIRCNKLTYQMPPKEYMVVPATVYDAIVTNATNTNGGFLAASAATTVGAFVGNATAAISVDASGKLLLQATQSGVTIPTVTTVTNQLTAAQIATGVWQDSTAGDFTVASSIGKTLYIANIAPGAANGLAIVGSAMTLSANQHVIVDSGTVTTVTNQLTAAQIATGVWTDTTASDFTTALSIGKSIMNGVALGTGLTVNDITTKTGFSLLAGSFVTATFGTCDFTSTMKTSITAAVPTVLAIADQVWDEIATDHLTTVSFGGLINTLFAPTGAIADLAPTVNTFKVSRTEPTNSFVDQPIKFTSGQLTGQVKPILSWTNHTTYSTVVVSEDFPQAPADADTFTIPAIHIHPVTQIAAGVLTAAQATPIYADVRTVEGTDATNYYDTLDDAVLLAIAALNNISTGNVSTAVTTALTTAIVESYRATGSTGSVAQLLYEILGNLINFGNVGTLKTVTKLNKLDTAKTYTYDSATDPITAIEETT